ncbi:MAG: hypothetical protein AB4042_05000 [Leptolyngbyaceae cyanobacterium]
MAVSSDFNVIPVRQTFDSNNRLFSVNFPVETGSARIVDDGYLIMQVRSVGEPGSHQLRLNGEIIPFDFQPAPGASQAWLAWMTTFRPGVLNSGTNRLEIERIGSDNFEVRDVVINWRERDSA